MACLGLHLGIQVAQRSSAFSNPKGRPAALLLGAWVLWAAVTALGTGWTESLGLTGGFAVVLAATWLTIEHGGRNAVARILGVGLTIYLCVSVTLVVFTTMPARVDERLTLASLEANQLARVAVLGALGGIWFVGETRGVARVVGMSTAVVGTAVLLATASRTSAAGFLVAVTVLALHAERRRLSALILGILLVLVSISLSGVSGLLDARPVAGLASRIDEPVQELGGRSILWPLILDEVEDSPVTGIGLGRDRDLMSSMRVGWRPQHAHNMVLHLLLTTGVVGAGLVLLAIATAMVRSVSVIDPFALTLLTFVLINGISEPVMRVPSFGWFAICAAAVLSGARTPIDGTTQALTNRQQER